MLQAMYGGPQRVAGGQFNLGYGGLKSPLAPIVNSAYQGNYSPMKKFGFGGFGGVDNHAAAEINDYRYRNGERPLDPDDLDNDNEADFLTATKHKIDNYLAKQYLMGRRKLTVSVNYANMPLEYQYLSQFHGFPNPVAGTPLGQKFGLTTQRNTYNNPRTPGAFTPPMQPPQPYMQQMASPQMVAPQVSVPSVPVAELGLDETTEPESEPEVAGVATNQTAAENQDREGNMAVSMIKIAAMGQTGYMPGQMAGQMGQMYGQMGQSGQMGGQMANMLRHLGQGGHQNQFMGGLAGMMNQYNPYPQNSMWQQHSMGGQSAMGQNSMAGQAGWGQMNPFSMNQQHQMGGQNNWGQMNQNPMSSLGQNSMGATGMLGQNAQNSMAGQIVPVHQPTHYGTQYNSAMPVMASASSSQDSSFDSTNNERKKK